MGIFGALTTAVTGLQAQSFALQNISGNIANASTVGYKEVNTSFEDMIASQAAPSAQVAGTVTASSVATNSVQGDFETESIGTYMAINGAGYFVVQQPQSFTGSGTPQFSGNDVYTRRGDFQTNAQGYLVNGAGYYLMGIPIDSTTGNLAGSVPQLLNFQSNLLPAQATTAIQYQANLASLPQTTEESASVPGSELLNPNTFSANPLAGSPAPAMITGFGANLQPDAPATLTATAVLPANTTTTGTFTINGQTVTIVPGMTPANVVSAIDAPVTVNGGTFATNGLTETPPGSITITATGLSGGSITISSFAHGDTATAVANKINSALEAAPTTDGIVASVVNGKVVLTSAFQHALSVSSADAQTLTDMGFASPGPQGSVTGTLPTGIQSVSLNSNNQLVLESTDPDTAITITGAAPSTLSELGLQVGTTNPTNLLTQSVVAEGQTMNIQVGSNQALPITFGTNLTANPPEISTLAQLEARLATLSGGSASVGPTGNIKIQANNLTDTVNITGTATMKNFGLQTETGYPSNQQVLGIDNTTFVDQSIGGGAITAYDSSGDPVNIQLRWAKTDSADLGTGHTDNWNLFYQVDSSATGTQVAWQNAGINYTFNSSGQLSPQITTTTLDNVTINGTSLGNIQVQFGAGGLTQFANPNGTAQVNVISQNGFAAGSLQTISVSDAGDVVGTYSNGRTINLAQVTLANFNGPDQLESLDGGAFAATDGSGPPTFNAPGQIVASSLEESNVDIADEFTKLIVTQQAYSANTKIVSTANDMVQDVLDMLR